MALGAENPQEEYFDELEIMPTPLREKRLNSKLALTINYAYNHAPAIKQIMDQAGVNPSQIQTTKDLEKLPVTRKVDLIDMQKASPPFGGFCMIPPGEVERVFISPGPIYEFQPSSIQWFARSFYAAGFRKGDIAVNTFTYHMSPAGILFHEGLRRCDTTVVVMGTGNTDTLIKTMHDLKVTGFVGTPSFLMTVVKRIEEMGYKLDKEFSLQRAWFTGEVLPTSLRKVIEGDYHIDTYQAYAVTEPGGAIAYECREKSGMHIMDDYVLEIIDHQTGKQLGPGEVGEVVVTPIHNNAWGLVRFGTGDMSSIITAPCPCGRTSYRLTGIAGRTGDAVKVRGMFIVAKQAEQAILSVNAISSFRLIVSRQNNKDLLTLQAEVKQEFPDNAELAEQINKKFQDICRLKLDSISFVAPGTIPTQSPKLVDERKWD